MTGRDERERAVHCANQEEERKEGEEEGKEGRADRTSVFVRAVCFVVLGS